MPFLAFLAFLVLFAGWRLSTRYKYSRKARAILSATAGAALVVSVLFNLWLFPGLNLLYLVLAVIGIFLPVYSVASLAIVEYWRKKKQAIFDANIVALRHEEEQLLETITKSQQQVAIAEHKRLTLEQVHRDKLSEQRRIRDFLENWERGDGLTRIRSIKIQEWQEGFRKTPRETLQTKRDELCAQLKEFERQPAGEVPQDRIDQLRAQLSVASLTMLAKVLDEPNAELDELERKVDEAKAGKTEGERSLDAIRYELAEWERRRNEFLADPIVLGS
jgi:hypothetical protein